jgi:hypothetical protein
MIKFLHVYSDFGAYQTIFMESLYASLALLPQFIHALTTVGLPSFGMPTLDAGISLDCFKLSLLLAALSYLLVPAVGYYKKNGLKTHGQAYFFAMEEVILRPGEEDDFLETVEEKVELVEEGDITFARSIGKKEVDYMFNTNPKMYVGTVVDEIGTSGSKAKLILHVDGMRTGRYRLKQQQPSWYLACVLDRVAMFSSLAVSAAQQILVWGGNLRWRKALRDPGWGGHRGDKWADTGMYMGSDEKKYHEKNTKTKYLWLWAMVPYVTPMKKKAWLRPYDFVSVGICEQFVKDNPGVKILHLGNCANLVTGVAGGNCGELLSARDV